MRARQGVQRCETNGTLVTWGLRMRWWTGVDVGVEPLGRDLGGVGGGNVGCARLQ
jgi:hypothetical protein